MLEHLGDETFDPWVCPIGAWDVGDIAPDWFDAVGVCPIGAWDVGRNGKNEHTRGTLGATFAASET